MCAAGGVAVELRQLLEAAHASSSSSSSSSASPHHQGLAQGAAAGGGHGGGAGGGGEEKSLLALKRQLAQALAERDAAVKRADRVGVEAQAAVEQHRYVCVCYIVCTYIRNTYTTYTPSNTHQAAE